MQNTWPIQETDRLQGVWRVELGGNSRHHAAVLSNRTLIVSALHAGILLS